jgi:hypothetical protein
MVLVITWRRRGREKHLELNDSNIFSVKFCHHRLCWHVPANLALSAQEKVGKEKKIHVQLVKDRPTSTRGNQPASTKPTTK